MKRLLGYALLGLLAFGLFLALRAPATLLTDRLAAQAQGFSVQDAIGTVIEGSAREVRWHGVRVAQLDWRWQALALLSGWLEFHWQTVDPAVALNGQIALNASRHIRWRAVRGQLPLAQLGALAGYPNPPVQGLVEFALEEMVCNATGRPRSARGVITLRDAHLTLGQPLPLGALRMQLTPAQPEGIQGAFKDQGGPLALEGVLKLAPDGRYQVTGQIKARDATPQALRQALQLLGAPGADGGWKLNFSGVLPP